MDNEESIVAAVFSKITVLLIGQIARQLAYFTHYKSIIVNLMKQVEKLKEKRNGLKLTIEEAVRNGDSILPEVQGWLEKVNNLCVNATIIYEGEVMENGCMKGWCPNLKARYILSKKAKKMAEAAAKFERVSFSKISQSTPPLAIGFSSKADFKSFESREPTIKEMVNVHLKGDEVSMIGICGMGGVGKTTMVEEIARRVRDEKLFDDVVMAVVSQNPDLMTIQDEIAYHLGMELKEKNSLSVRADCLCKRLMQSSKGNLVILDDVWGSLDFKEIGIPYGGENNKCKIVLTSRSADVCKVMRCGRIFKVEVLSEQEAWSLFRGMAGDCVDAPDLYLTASKVARECGGLPIAVITLGKALSEKSKEVWDDAFVQLTKSIIPTTLSEVEPKVYRSLQLSYDFLESKEAKSLFLLCCLFSENTNIHLEVLVRYGVGLRLFDGIDLITQARDRVLALTMKLKGCFLLLDGNGRSSVKLHDVVRDVGISIGSKENNFNMKMIHGGEWPKVRDDAYKDCNALSIISDKISDLPSEGLDCPNLEVLQLTCRNLSLKALNRRNVFEGMTRLRVFHMWGMRLESLPSSVHLLKQLRVLQFKNLNKDRDRWGVDNWGVEICDILKDLGNLEILSIGFFPENIECLTNLRLLDLRKCRPGICIPPSVFSCLRALEDLHTGDWEPAKEGDKSGNASFSHLEQLSKLTSLVIQVPHAGFLPKNHFLKKLKSYIIFVAKYSDIGFQNYNSINWFLKKSLFLNFGSNNDAPLGGGIDYLLKESAESLSLKGDGLKTVFDQLFQLDGSKHLTELCIRQCNERVEYLVDTSRAEIGIFPKLVKLFLKDVTHLKEICHGQKLPEGSFGSLQMMDIRNLPALTHLWEYENVKLSNLRHVWVSSCKLLKNMFTLSVARSLVNLESLEIQKISEMEEVIINQGPTGATETDRLELADIQKIEFPKLRKLTLRMLRGLTCFSKGIDHINLPQLTELHINYLPKLKSFYSEGNKNVALEDNHTVQLQPLFNHKVKLSNLKILYLAFQKDMKDIWNDQLDGDSFYELKSVKVFSCKGISTVLPCNMTPGFQNLEELCIEGCCLVEEVFEYGELKNVSKEGHAAAELLPRLKKLDLHGLPKLTQIWKREIKMNQDFKELSFIHIERCNGMKLVFSSSTAKVLVKLQKLSITNCKMVEHVVANDHPEGEISERSAMEFHNLKSLYLKGLPNLTSVYSGWLSFPSLVELKFDGCKKLKMFSLSSFGDSEINRPPLFNNKVTFPLLKELQLIGMPSIEKLWCSSIPTMSFRKARVLKVVGCKKLVNIIPSHLHEVLLSLKVLEVSKCDSMKELFDSKGANTGGGHHATLTKTLKSIKVEECNHMRNLFPSSIARGLVNLQLLQVKSCPLIEYIFMEKADKDGGEDTTLFPALKILELSNLQRLKSVFNVNYTIQLPVLHKLIICDCFEMTTFSSSFVSTPKLNYRGPREHIRNGKGHAMRENFFWKGDLNKTIEHAFKEKEFATCLLCNKVGHIAPQCFTHGNKAYFAQCTNPTNTPSSYIRQHPILPQLTPSPKIDSIISIASSSTSSIDFWIGL